MAALHKFFNITLTFLLLAAATAYTQNPLTRNFTKPVTCLPVTLPITFSWVDYTTKPEKVPPAVKEKIQLSVIDFVLESNGGDSSEITTAQNYYFNTLRAPFNGLQLYIVIMKTSHFAYAHCKLFLYDSVHAKVAAKTTDYNTWAMYGIEDNRLKRSELFKSLEVESDDISETKPKKPMLTLIRVKHNGTFNDLETIVYRANGVSLDTVSSKLTPLQDP